MMCDLIGALTVVQHRLCKAQDEVLISITRVGGMILDTAT
jgi:hypothetical protein